MVRGDAFTGSEMRELMQHPLLSPMLKNLVIVGDGIIEYPVLLELLQKCSPDASLMVEHIKSEADAQKAVSYIKSIASGAGITLN